MNNKNRILTGALISSLMLISVNSYAADQGWYGGISLGTTTVDTGVSGLSGAAVLDENDSGLKFIVGKKIDKNLSIEGFYADFGEASLTGNNGDNFSIDGTAYVFTADNVSIKTAASGLGINAKYSHDFTSKSSIVGRLGLLMWDLEASVAVGSTAASSSNTGTDLFYGIGYKYNISKKYSLTADYESYTMDSLDSSMVSVGAIFNF